MPLPFTEMTRESEIKIELDSASQKKKSFTLKE
jgi:hypothetical protein